MNILHLVTGWSNKWDVLYPAYKYLPKAQVYLGHKVEVVAGTEERPTEEDKIHSIFPEDLKISPLPGKLSNDLHSNLKSGIKYGVIFIKKVILGKSIQIVHVYGKSGFIASLVKILLRPKKILYFVYFSECSKSSYKKSKDKKPKLSFLEKHLIKRIELFSEKINIKASSYCLVLDNQILNEFISLYPKSQRKFINMKTGTEYAKDEIDSTVQLSFYKTIIIPLESSNVEKLLIWVEALKYLNSEFEIKFIGDIGNSLADRINELAINLNVVNRIEFITNPQRDQLIRILREGFCIVSANQDQYYNPTEKLGLGYGVPVFSYLVKKEAFLRGLILLESHTPKSIAMQLKKLDKEPIHVDFVMARKNFGWNNIARNLDKIYKKHIIDSA